MRLSDPSTLHILGLYALAPVAAALGLGWPAALLASLAMGIIGVTVRLRRLGNPGDAGMELHTITYSHYVEKVRWCLDRAGLPYREVPTVGILGLLLTGRTVPLLVLPASRTSIGDSPQILRFLWGAYGSCGDPRLRFLEPTAERLALERHFDRDLGVNVRLWSYGQLLPQRELLLQMWGAGEPSIPAWQRRLLPFVAPLLAAMLRRMLGVTEERAAAGLEATRAVFAEVGAMLSDGRRYLTGDELSFVDITFASLAALALFPDDYAGRAAAIRTAPLERLPAAWRAEVEALRATDAGQFVMRLYREHRLAA